MRPRPKVDPTIDERERAKRAFQERFDAGRQMRLDVPEIAAASLRRARATEAGLSRDALQEAFRRAPELLAVDLDAPDALERLAEAGAVVMHRMHASGRAS